MKVKKDENGFFKLSDLYTEEFFQEMKRHGEIEEEFLRTKNTPKQWATIRKVYDAMLPDILEASAECVFAMVDPYYVDWSLIFTPIEADAWHSIRYKGIPLYPQFPVLNYFIDFASPYLKIGVELDGKAYHDPIRDKARDERLAAEGWKIFRIPGRECHVKFKHPAELREREAEQYEIDDAYRHWILNTSDGVFQAIDWLYFRGGATPYYEIAVESLRLHRLV